MRNPHARPYLYYVRLRRTAFHEIRDENANEHETWGKKSAKGAVIKMLPP